MDDNTLSYGVAILARFDPRLTQATLASVRAATSNFGSIVLVVPHSRRHVFAAFPTEIDTDIDYITANDDELQSAAVAALVPSADIGIVVPEGMIFDADYFKVLRHKVEDFEDRVGAIDLVYQVLKIDSAGEEHKAELNLDDHPHERPLISTLRAMLAARSLLGAVFWVRTAALGQIKLATTAQLSDTLVYALALDALRARGRTEINFTPNAYELRLTPERRSGYDAGYRLYHHLYQITEGQSVERTIRPVKPSHLGTGTERARLIFTQVVRALASPENRFHARTFLQGALAAWRDARNVGRTVQRDLRYMR